MAWNLTLSKVNMGDGIIAIRVTSNETPTPNFSDAICGGTQRTWTLQRQREGGAWVTVYTGSPTLSTFQYDDTSLYYDGDYAYRLSYVETFWTNTNVGNESEPLCIQDTSNSSWVTSAEINWSNVYDDPDPVTYPPKRYQNLNVWVASVARTLTGMGAGGAYIRRAYGSGTTAAFRINSGAWITDDNEYLVANGDTIQMRVLMANAEGVARGSGAICGGVLLWFVARTYPNLAEEGVQFPTTGEVSYNTLAQVFGPQSALNGGAPINPADYYRGGPFIHDITPNAAVPTTAPFNFPADFRGAVGYPEIFGVDAGVAVSRHPDPAVAVIDALSAIVGAEAEFYWTVTPTSGPTPGASQTNPGVYSTANRYLTLSLPSASGVEREAVGTFTLFIRVISTGELIQRTGSYFLMTTDPSTM